MFFKRILVTSFSFALIGGMLPVINLGSAFAKEASSYQTIAINSKSLNADSIYGKNDVMSSGDVKTADTSSLVLLIVISVLSAAGACYIYSLRCKKNS